MNKSSEPPPKSNTKLNKYELILKILIHIFIIVTMAANGVLNLEWDVQNAHMGVIGQVSIDICLHSELFC